jgi:hypothetical protein
MKKTCLTLLAVLFVFSVSSNASATPNNRNGNLTAASHNLNGFQAENGVTVKLVTRGHHYGGHHYRGHRHGGHYRSHRFGYGGFRFNHYRPYYRPYGNYYQKPHRGHYRGGHRHSGYNNHRRHDRGHDYGHNNRHGRGGRSSHDRRH